MTDLHIQKVLDGDTDAFRYIIRQYKDDAYSLAISIVKDEFIAKDVLQNSFIRVYSRLNTFNRKSKFSTWLYRIVFNESLKFLKKQKKDSMVFEKDLPHEVTDLSDNFILKMNKDHQRYYINEALKKLTPNESMVLRLFYLLENSIEDITQITGWSVSKIKVTLHRGRRNMKRVMKSIHNINKQDLYR